MLHLAYKPPSSAPSLAHWQARQARRFLLSFGGKSEPNSPKSGKGPHNGFKLRQLIASTLLQRKTTLNSSDADVALRFFSPQSSRADIAALHLDMAQSTFCLQPPGDSPTRKGFFDSILLGCIPVIFRRDTYSRIPLRRYTGQPVNVEDEVAYFLDADSLIGNVTSDEGDLVDRLRAVPAAEVVCRQQAIAELAHKLQYSLPTAAERPADVLGWGSDDAFEMLVRQLLEIRDVGERVSDAKGT